MYISRIQFLFLFLNLSGMACQSHEKILNAPVTETSPLATILSQREYEVRQRLTLVNDGPGQPEKQNIWIALIQDFPPYQEVLSMEITPNMYLITTDELGNQYAEFDFSNHPAGTTKTVEINYQIRVNELTYDLSTCEGELIDDFIQPELYIESANPQIISLASDLSQGKKNPCEQVRAFHNYIGDTLTYTYNGRNWGAQAALGIMGADCTEYTSLLVALSRSQGIPARYFEGLLLLNRETEGMARIEHAWADVYLPNVGWVAVDPTLGRSLLKRDTYFAHYTPEHIIVTMGSNPSTLRNSNYWTHLYWPGNSTVIRIDTKEWEIRLIE